MHNFLVHLGHLRIGIKGMNAYVVSCDVCVHVGVACCTHSNCAMLEPRLQVVTIGGYTQAIPQPSLGGIEAKACDERLKLTDAQHLEKGRRAAALTAALREPGTPHVVHAIVHAIVSKPRRGMIRS